MNRQEERSSQTKAAILNAAEQEFSEKGIYGARMDQIAKEANCNKSLIYQYFGNKDSLYELVLNRVYSRLGDFEMEVIREHGSWKKGLQKIVKTYFYFLKENPSYVRMLMWENLNYGRYFKEGELKQTKDPIRKELERILLLGKEAGEVKQDISAVEVLQTLIACSFNYFSNTYTLGYVLRKDLMEDEQIEKRIKEVSRMILCYLEN